MGSVAREISNPVQHQVGQGQSLVPIIADWGETAAVVVLPFARLPRVGDSFRFRGCDWVITRDRDHARTYVARPIRRRR